MIFFEFFVNQYLKIKRYASLEKITIFFQQLTNEEIYFLFNFFVESCLKNIHGDINQNYQNAKMLKKIQQKLLYIKNSSCINKNYTLIVAVLTKIQNFIIIPNQQKTCSKPNKSDKTPNKTDFLGLQKK